MRDLAWLRDKLNHPIHWDRDSQTYRWTPEPGEHDAPQEVAGLWFKPSEVLALLTLQHLIEDVQPRDLLHRHIQPLEQRLHAILKKEGLSDSFARLHKRFRIIGLGKRAVQPLCFEAVGMALVERKRLSMHYQARGTAQSTERTVSPQRLVYYRSNWLLDAWCHHRNELRSFSLDNISHPHIQDQPAIDVSEDDLNQTLGNGYGIFSGKAVLWATLRFTPERARWVAAEQWHSAQKGEWDAQGHWLLQIPYSDDRELVMDILRHTPDVEVLAPAALRARVLERMLEGVKRWGVA